MSFEKCKELDRCNERRPNTDASSVLSNEVGSIFNTVSSSLNNSTTLISSSTNVNNYPKIEIINYNNNNESFSISNLNQISINLVEADCDEIDKKVNSLKIATATRGEVEEQGSSQWGKSSNFSHVTLIRFYYYFPLI